MGMVLQRLGVLLIVPDYRNFPQATGEEMVEDVTLAVQWSLDHCREYGGDPSRLFVAGQSAGAHLLAMALLRRADRVHCESQVTAPVETKQITPISWKPKELAAFVGISGPFDLVDLAGHFHERGLDKRILSSIFEGRLAEFSPTRLVDRHRAKQLPPALLVHGTADSSVPSRSASDFAAALQTAGAEVNIKLYAGKSHTDPILEDPMAGNDPLIEELSQLVRSTEPSKAIKLICEGCAKLGKDVELDAAIPQGRRMMPLPVLQLARIINPF
mmetsp:Transcript_34869/g.64920  ORF Transcript_34869/g.64920 Transcript_34869/m.64920 type:complete len:272 (+) Transcript_34869:1-816(+)